MSVLWHLPSDLHQVHLGTRWTKRKTEPLWLTLGDPQSVRGWLLVCEDGCAIQGIHPLPHLTSPTPRRVSKVLPDA